MYQSKLGDAGLVILCPNRNIPALRNTVRRLGFFFPEAPCVAVKPKGTSRAETAEMKAICEVTAGKETDLSLINAGLKKSSRDWNFIIYEGAVMRPRFHVRYEHFLEDEKDVMFPIVNSQQIDFIEGTMNGLLIHKNTWKDVGLFEEKVDIFIGKALWAYEANKKGVKFKALLGAKMI